MQRRTTTHTTEINQTGTLDSAQKVFQKLLTFLTLLTFRCYKTFNTSPFLTQRADNAIPSAMT